MNRNAWILIWVTAFSSAAIAAPDPATQETLHGEPARNDPGSQQFMSRMAQNANLQSAAAGLALSRSHDDGIKDLAEKLQNDCRTVNDELQRLMSSAPAGPAIESGDAAKTLRTDGDSEFDRAFLDQTIRLQQEAVALLTDASRDAHLANDLRALAARLLPAALAHLQAARDLLKPANAAATAP